MRGTTRKTRGNRLLHMMGECFGGAGGSCCNIARVRCCLNEPPPMFVLFSHNRPTASVFFFRGTTSTVNAETSNVMMVHRQSKQKEQENPRAINKCVVHATYA